MGIHRNMTAVVGSPKTVNCSFNYPACRGAGRLFIEKSQSVLPVCVPARPCHAGNMPFPRALQSHLALINPYANEVVEFLLDILKAPEVEMNIKDSAALVRERNCWIFS